MCAPYEKVQTIKIVGSKKNKPPSIYAYLIMETSDAAVRLLQALQGVKFSDNELKIKQKRAAPLGSSRQSKNFRNCSISALA
ncbi:hypothetical protein MN116_001104 [Schistosoma mekongi]|uniref:RRM domain-containing protein n=1 Tax=Schistosoma mekongi TaxID=38744 RepID=A0AAE2DA50_SCHME|nr:hypothetical protein MN116_001104 [Schistosoma mekongi]